MSKDRSAFSYWEKRGETYSALDDVKSKRTPYKIVNFIKPLGLDKSSWILDAGCGKGTITKIIKDNWRHSNVVGIDLSQRMIDGAMNKETNGLRFSCIDYFDFISELKSFFNLITMSLFIHHLTDGADVEALERAYEALRPNGRIVIAEAIPPEDDIFDHYQQIFKLKEDRNCYSLPDLLRRLRGAGFVDLRFQTYPFDIRPLSWLDDNTLSKERKSLLYDLHVSASPAFKKAYNMMPLQNGDYRLRCKMALISGIKKS